MSFPKDMRECHCNVDKKMNPSLMSEEQIGTGAYSDVTRVGISSSEQNFTQKGVSAIGPPRYVIIYITSD